MSSISMGLRMRAPAKINLGLEVIRRRADGYHDINTVFIPLDLYDEILLRLLDDGRIELRVEGNDELGAGPDNLCIRAAIALRERLGCEELGLDITLTKRIPMGAGLGGGSSDAASILLGAASLWGDTQGVPRPILHEIAASLGSDVPFFLLGGAAQASSRGEDLRPLDITLPYTVLLVNPGIHVPTPWAYGMVGRTDERPASDLPALIDQGMRSPELLRTAILNDFEPAIFNAHPLLAELKERLYAHGALFALMSGSGSTMFGLFSDAEGAEKAAGHFKDYWSVVASQTTGKSSVIL
jgi:4-diphosphocytidyl-2-C-methyl-D-erythritol kinase